MELWIAYNEGTKQMHRARCVVREGSSMSDTITPKALAEELNIDAKRLRGWLRKNHERDLTAKNTTWAIDAETADAARERFAKAVESTDEA